MTQIKRDTKETQIQCSLDISKSGDTVINTGVGFLDHMLEAFSKHSGISLNIQCNGDTHIDDHHSVEDCGIVIGQALKKEIFPIKEVERYGNATVVMDEASSTCDLDLSNRPYLVYEFNIFGKVGNFDVELVEEFFHALVLNAGITCHLIYNRGTNKHHIIEATFKSFAISLRRALQENKSIGIPSTKGIL
jgi:imidazoleglycerol-phosphate dehydratase